VASKGADLAKALREKTQEVIGTLEPLTDEDWRTVCSAESWPAGLVAYHIALHVERQAGWIDDAMRGADPFQFSWDVTHEMNAAFAQAQLVPSKSFVLAALKTSTDRLHGLLEAAADEDLDQVILIHSGKGGSAEAVLRTLMRDIEEHYASIKRSIAG
jgi:hypothetical protein